MATKAEGVPLDIVCEKCRLRKVVKEYLIFETEIIYLCEDCAKFVMPLLPYVGGKKEEEH